MKRMNFPARREKRRLEAEERDKYRSTLTTAQQLERTASRPGSSARETDRLMGRPRGRKKKKVA